MPRKNGHLTRREITVARAAAATGEDLSETARRAGLSVSGAWRALQRPAVRALILREQQNRLVNELLPLAIDTLAKVMSDNLATNAARTRAAEVTLKYALKPEGDAADKDPSQMTGEELHELAQRLRRELSDRAKPVIDQASAGVFD